MTGNAKTGAAPRPMGSFFCTKIVVKNLDLCANFYRAALGFEEIARIVAEMGGEPLEQIILQNPTTSAEQLVVIHFPDRVGPIANQTFIGFMTAEADAFLAGVVTAGGMVVSAKAYIADHKVHVALAADPEGNVIEVVQPD